MVVDKNEKREHTMKGWGGKKRVVEREWTLGNNRFPVQCI
jgi:hypothetical protein